jgi:type I restriction enzyme, R subunit
MQWIAPAEKDVATDTLEKRLWDSADQFRANSELKAQEYSGPILGIIFLRFATVRFAEQRAMLEKAAGSSRRGSRLDEPGAYHSEGILYLAPNARFDFLLNLPEGSDIGAKVNEANRGVVLAAMEQFPAGSMQRLQRLDDAVNALISADPLRREFFGHERLVSTLYNAVKPDPSVLEFAGRVACLAAIGETIRTKLNPNPPDVSAMMGEIDKLLDESIEGVAMRSQASPVMDLSKIDFEALGRKFKESKHKNTDIEVLKAAIRAMLEKLIRLNNTRADFAEKFEELIESYNSGSRKIEELFQELLKFSRNLTQEQQRHIREHLTEEELVVLDILTRPAPELSPAERDEVKKVAKQLLERVKGLLVLDWRKRQSSRARVEDTIKDLLDTGLPRAYTPELYQQKCARMFEHFFETYPENGVGVYVGSM